MRLDRRLKLRNGGGGFGRPGSQIRPPIHNSLRPKKGLDLEVHFQESIRNRFSIAENQDIIASIMPVGYSDTRTSQGMSRRSSLLGLCALAACRQSSLRRLNVLNWSNYVAPQTIPNFEREFGVEVRYSTYESNEELGARIFSGNSGWDIVFPSNHYIIPLRESDLLAPLRLDLITNLSNLDATFRHPVWDPELRYCIPYMWGATGIVFNRQLGWEPRSWSSLWDERLRGRLTMLDDPAEVFGSALKKIGLSLNSTSGTELRAAQAEAIRQKPLVRAYLNAEVRDQLVSGDVLCAQLWNTTAQQAMDSAADLVT